MTQKWYVILRHQKLHPHTKFGILTFNNIKNAPDTIFLKTRSEVKVTVTLKMVQDTPPSQDAFIHQNWDSYPILFLNNIRDMLLTQLSLKLGQRSRSQ